MAKFTKLIQLPSEDAGLENSIARFNNTHIGKSKIRRRTAILIKNLDNRNWTIRYAMGSSSSFKWINKDALAVDYDTFCDLEISIGNADNLDIEVRRAKLYECAIWLANSTNLNVRLSFRLAILGGLLGLLGLAISIIGLF